MTRPCSARTACGAGRKGSRVEKARENQARCEESEEGRQAAGCEKICQESGQEVRYKNEIEAESSAFSTEPTEGSDKTEDRADRQDRARRNARAGVPARQPLLPHDRHRVPERRAAYRPRL